MKAMANEETDVLATISDQELKREIQRLPDVLGQEDLYRLSQSVRGTPDYSLDNLTALLDRRGVRPVWRFAAMYCLLVRARHLRNFDDFRDLVRKFKDEFANQPAMLAMVAESDSYFAFTPHEKKAVVAKCRSALKRFDAVGLKLLTAEMLLDVSVAEPPERAELLLSEAESCVSDALAQYPKLPRYLAVMAQVLGRRGRFDEARAYITEAISLENSSHSQYSIRIARYEAVRSEIAFREFVWHLSSRLEEAVADFDDTRGSLIELVGLLAAMLALVIVGTQLSLNVPAAQGAGMLMVIGAVLLVSFVGYSLVVGKSPRAGRVAITIVMAVLLMAVGVSFILKLVPQPENSIVPGSTAPAAMSR